MSFPRGVPLVSCRLLSRPSLSLMSHPPKRFLYEQTRSGSLAFERKKEELRRKEGGTEMQRFKKHVQDYKEQLKLFFTDLKDRSVHAFSSDNKRMGFHDMELVKFWDFNQANNHRISSFRLAYKKDKLNDIANWYTRCDSDFDIGFSKSSWTVSPSGYGLFSGYLDRTLPKDGKVIRTGYAYCGSYQSRKHFFFPEEHHEFADMTHVVLRVRGDGRRYFLMFDTSSALDITWFDRNQYPIYTHGGPYWQYIKIPLTRFYFHYQGYLQDVQTILQPDTIRSVGFVVYDNFSGPFSLEIDYIGFLRDDQHNDSIEYEGYAIEESPFKSLGSV